ncbi:MAG: hypothetical protein EYC70_07715 [Planctomycetota bacterium]|nr:MAG: hypothetical protein EYC70_07715 [Planctomycetota bacterium]
MATLREERQRKLELLERYAAARREKLLATLRAQAQAEAASGRYPWKGEFRTREEILELYRERRKWDRRFLFDLLLAAVACIGLLGAGAMLVKIYTPDKIAARQK